jgi:hypothetical protein
LDCQRFSVPGHDEALASTDPKSNETRAGNGRLSSHEQTLSEQGASFVHAMAGECHGWGQGWNVRRVCRLAARE